MRTNIKAKRYKVNIHRKYYNVHFVNVMWKSIEKYINSRTIIRNHEMT